MPKKQSTSRNHSKNAQNPTETLLTSSNACHRSHRATQGSANRYPNNNFPFGASIPRTWLQSILLAAHRRSTPNRVQIERSEASDPRSIAEGAGADRLGRAVARFTRFTNGSGLQATTSDRARVTAAGCRITRGAAGAGARSVVEIPWAGGAV